MGDEWEGAMSRKLRKETVSRRRGGAAARRAEVAEKKYRGEPVDLVTRSLASKQYSTWLGQDDVR